MQYISGDLAHYDGAQHSAHGQLIEPANYLAIEQDLTLLGFAGLEDPPRPEVRDAVRDCQLAGIRVCYASCTCRAHHESNMLRCYISDVSACLTLIWQSCPSGCAAALELVMHGLTAVSWCVP